MTFDRASSTQAPRRLAPLLLLVVLLAGCGSMPASNGSVSSSSAVGYLADIRKAEGLAPMKRDRALEKAALKQARYMAGARRMAHTTGAGRDFATRMHQEEITLAAENIAYGRMDLARLFRMWKDSPPHRRNILDPRFSHFGLASAEDRDGVRYWALVLGK